MADEGQVIRGINWRQTFPFVNIFRSFRIAIHPSKLFLGLALLLTVYFGGRILDAIWPIHQRALPGEVEQYQVGLRGDNPKTLKDWRKDTEKANDAAYENILFETVDKPATGPHDAPPDEKEVERAHKTAHDDAVARDKISDVIALGEADLKKQITKIDKDKEDQDKEIEKTYKDNKESNAGKLRDDAHKANSDAHDAAVKTAYKEGAVGMQTVELFRNVGIFDAFFNYEINQVDGVVKAVKHGEWLSAGVFEGVPEASVVQRIENFLTVGPVWLVTSHTVFAILFGILFLFAWSIFGGAISRISAVHIARDEKISIRQAMNFAVGKFLSFASAPVIPMLIVIFIGLLVSAAALIGNIPFVGPIIVGALFFLPLIAGFVMTLVLLGTAGGFSLMYPTVAVEGSDSFDAISRSFSYVYARPWRMLFYTAVAIAYGAATYIFVHLFIWLMLVLTHHFVGWGMMTHAYNLNEVLNVMWPNPRETGRLAYSVDYLPLGPGEAFGAHLIQIWVMLLVAFLGAFAISMFFSSNTVIYYLMRSEVDATEMDDVYLEQSDEDFGEAAPVTTPAGVTPTPPAPEVPPAAPPATT